MKLIVWMIQKEFQDAESSRSGNSHVTSRPVSFPPHPIPAGNAKPFFWSAEPAEKGRHAFGIHMVYRETFLQIHMHLSSAPYPQELNPWSTTIEEPLHMSTAEKKWKTRTKIKIRDASLDSQPKIQSSSVEETLQRIMVQTKQRLQISDLHFDKVPTPATFACWKIRSKTEVCTCSQFPTEAMQWIKEVELVDSVDGIKIFVIYSWYFNAEFWSTWCEDSFSTE